MILFDKKKGLKLSRNILFICHESSRTGAPVFLLYFIRWVKKHTDQDFYILIEKAGVLEESFRELGPTWVVRPSGISFFYKIWSKLSYPSFINFRLRSLLKKPVGLIYQNTIGKGLLISGLKKRMNCPVITHIHELESVIRSTGMTNVQLIKDTTNHFIAASKAVKNNLIKNHQIPDDKITIHYECIEPIPDKEGNSQSLLPICIEDSDFVVGGAGFVDYRKGFDLFLETAKRILVENNWEGFKFVWIGDFGRNKQKIIENFIQENNLSAFVCFLGEIQDPFPVYRKFDLFFLTSREDPFPLVMLENAYLGNPVIGFKGSGGIEEFLEQDSELLVKDFDTGLAANKILYLKNNPFNLSEYGKHQKNKVMKNHMMDSCGRQYFNRIIELTGTG